MKINNNLNILINIETLVLVAVWSAPIVFQGSFTIFDRKNGKQYLIFYRCECQKANQTDILDDEFSPFDYQFTYLYAGSVRLHDNIFNQLSEDAIYLLQYALYLTVTKMLTTKKQNYIYIDEMALHSLTESIKQKFAEGKNFEMDAEIGFAVAMDFNPQEQAALYAVSSLLSCLAVESKSM
ncbi:hypothetical protein [Legionella pneumophila]|uniref:Uncharacterized protein n=1 Tax=Legionella pneumophila subsp. pascullei TaxID=91890 RepID=A0AAX2J0L5_LEGPN|nr:hypothetical protein [Legionella pneumophila]AMP90827.1 hypothetical protein AXF35_14450 [Legionella pneumophila subsp. pascullei]AMP93811.1 hypothetical protein AXF36_14815 [Legionella pneumophila subsp. pascullei]AMP96728.1 hypothetical protein AXF37_14450 [Legionella pneumophila subsp. pascullei]SQG91777.1 Uncharacterised protein [Legionella pneumophila subsp. pascullei]VEH08323.1 Uncharacterised protein [Legionella pneumophila subsp. pascullei]